VLTEINTPYRPELCYHAGTYCLSVNGHPYYGSTSYLGVRRSDHRMKLRRNEHPNKVMQAAFNEHPESLQFTVLSIWQGKSKPEAKKMRVILREAEQKLLDSAQHEGALLNASSSATYNSNISKTLKDKWADPAFRKAQMVAVQARKGVPVTQEARKKMSDAKKGGKNYNARACVVQFEGKTHRFDCVTDAARHFGVKQQIMHGWMCGLFPFPGSGSRNPRRSNRHLIGMTGRYVD